MKKVLALVSPEDYVTNTLAVFKTPDGDLAQFTAKEVEAAEEIEGGYLLKDGVVSFELTPEQYEAAKAHLGISA